MKAVLLLGFGITNQKVDPLPSSLSIFILPSCLLTISEEM